MENGIRKNSILTKPIERSSTPKENEDVEFKLSKLEKVVESKKDEMVRKLTS